jgi:hypothetical protein
MFQQARRQGRAWSPGHERKRYEGNCAASDRKRCKGPETRDTTQEAPTHKRRQDSRAEADRGEQFVEVRSCGYHCLRKALLGCVQCRGVSNSRRIVRQACSRAHLSACWTTADPTPRPRYLGSAASMPNSPIPSFKRLTFTDPTSMPSISARSALEREAAVRPRRDLSECPFASTCPIQRRRTPH